MNTHNNTAPYELKTGETILSKSVAGFLIDVDHNTIKVVRNGKEPRLIAKDDTIPYAPLTYRNCLEYGEVYLDYDGRVMAEISNVIERKRIITEWQNTAVFSDGYLALKAAYRVDRTGRRDNGQFKERHKDNY